MLGYTFANAQYTLSNIRTKHISYGASPIFLDSLSIVPNSVQFFHHELPIDIDFQIKSDSIYIGEIHHDAHSNTPDSISIMYRVLPIYLGSRYSHLDSLQLLPKAEDLYIGYDFNIYENKNQDFLFSKGLRYDGSFSRGLSFGNSQSLVLNSNFNLQLGGNLGDDLEIMAVISDANIPIQAQGTTQQLQDFDKVFIQLKKENTTLIAGDYEMSRPNSYFINYYKKLQGISIMQQNNFGNYGQLSQKGSAAISRGKFSRNTLEVREGNQGPYKLTGSEGERFIIVLSGTEKVYFDGRLLNRGEENDYVIFYDRAEIVFTTNRLITKDSRIIVEFEYADQKYLRSLYQYQTSWEREKLSIDFSFISEQDSRSSTGVLDLDSLDLRLLSEAGDQDAGALRSGISRNTEGYNNSRIYYYKAYDERSLDSFLVYTKRPDSAAYLATFSDVGEGNGAYVIDDKINANGRVYKYVGKGNGNYDPLIRLVAPEQKQMYALRTNYQPFKDGHIILEMGMSYFDLNRFSEIGDADNVGLSGRFEFNQKLFIGSNNNWVLTPFMGVELKGSNFQSLNPYRNAEFNRDWNIVGDHKNDELLGNIGFQINDINKTVSLNYNLNNFSQFSNYQGNKHQFNGNFQKNGFLIDIQNNFLTASSELSSSTFSRPKITISKQFKKLDNWSIGWYGEREKNELYDKNSNILSPNSFLYDYSKWYIKSDQKDNFGFGFGYNKRVDYSPIPGSFTTSTTANEFELSGLWRVKSASNASWSFTYRSLEINDSALTQENANSVLLGNFNHILRLWKGAFNSTLNYKVSSGQEPKVEFDFREVLPGEGDYIWIDDGNGIQERNEFQISPFRDQANFVRINLFNNEFIRTNNAGFTQSLRIEPKTYFRGIEDENMFHSFISKFSLISNFRIDNKNEGNSSILSLQQFNANDTSLVSFSSFYNGILYYNKGNPGFDIQLGVKNNANKIAQTLGYEQRGISEYYLRNRIAMKKNIDFITVFTQSGKTLRSEIFKNNDFIINSMKIEPQLVYRIGNQIRFNASYVHEQKANSLGDGKERAIINDIKIGFIYSRERTSRINSELKFASINYNGLPNTALELNMLDGLKNGKNMLWAIDYSKRIMKNIDLSITYEGRRTGGNRVIHVGRAQVKSSF